MKEGWKVKEVKEGKEVKRRKEDIKEIFLFCAA
jgi:hypothetical protein